MTKSQASSTERQTQRSPRVARLSSPRLGNVANRVSPPSILQDALSQNVRIEDSFDVGQRMGNVFSSILQRFANQSARGDVSHVDSPSPSNSGRGTLPRVLPPECLPFSDTHRNIMNVFNRSEPQNDPQSVTFQDVSHEDGPSPSNRGRVTIPRVSPPSISEEENIQTVPSGQQNILNQLNRRSQPVSREDCSASNRKSASERGNVHGRVKRQGTARQHDTVSSVSNRGPTNRKFARSGDQNILNQLASPRAPKPVSREDGSSSNRESVSLSSVSERGNASPRVEQGTARQPDSSSVSNSDVGQQDAAGTISRQLLQSEKHIEALNKEFKFAVDCLKTLLQGFGFSAAISAPLANRSTDKFCTQDIKTAILHIVGKELPGTINLMCEDWFGCGDEFKHGRIQDLIELITTDFCYTPCTLRKFLDYCCKVGEFSARLYILSESHAGTCGVISIFYAIIHSMENNLINNFASWTELDNLAKIINEQYSDNSDPMACVNDQRRRSFLKFNKGHLIP